MLLANSLATFGHYCIFMRRVFSIPEKWRVFFKRTVAEIMKLGIDSIPLVMIISVFIGAVIAIQMQLNIASPLIPSYTVGLATRDIVLLEFSNSILCLILAGKVGSNIASEIGTMRVTEQIDALEIMGVNSASFLVLPKVLGFLLFIPVLVIFSIGTAFIGRVHGHHYRITLCLRTTGALQRVVCMVRSHQVLGVLIHYHLGIVLLRLLCQGRRPRSRQSQHQWCCIQ